MRACLVNEAVRRWLWGIHLLQRLRVPPGFPSFPRMPVVMLLQLGAPTLCLRKRTPQSHLLYVGNSVCLMRAFSGLVKSLQWVYRFCPVFCLSIVLSGCGFHLRGVEIAVVDIGTVYLDVGNEHGEIEQLLLRHFERNNVEVVTSPENAAFSLYISEERNYRRPVVTTMDIRVAEYEIRQEVDIELKASSGKLLVPMAVVFAERTYTFDDENLESSSDEEALLLREMRQDLVRQIFWRMNTTIRNARESLQPVKSLQPVENH